MNIDLTGRKAVVTGSTSAKEQGITQEEAEQHFLETMRPTTLINRFTTTEEVANMVVYVSSEQASGTTRRGLACRRRCRSDNRRRHPRVLSIQASIRRIS